MSYYAHGDALGLEIVHGDETYGFLNDNQGNVYQAVQGSMNINNADQVGQRQRTITYSHCAPDVWPSISFMPINPGPVQVHNQPGPEMPLEAPPSPTSSEDRFERHLRLHSRAEGPGMGGASACDSLDESDTWLGVADRDLAPIQRQIRRGILLRDAKNRVARRPSDLAPGCIPPGPGAGLRDNSPTPAPRHRRSQLGGGQAVSSLSSMTRLPEYQLTTPPSMDNLTQQYGLSANMVGGGVADLGASGMVLRQPQHQLMPDHASYSGVVPEERVIFAPPVFWGRGDGMSAYDSAYGSWESYANASGAQFYGGCEYNWAGYTNVVQPGQLTPEEYLGGAGIDAVDNGYGQAETIYDSMGNPAES